jgi:hypothetical protein
MNKQQKKSFVKGGLFGGPGEDGKGKEKVCRGEYDQSTLYEQMKKYN